MDARIAAFLAELPVPAERVVAVGWATVDLERAADELTAFDAGLGPFEPRPDDRFLGARCLASARVRVDGPRLVLLEPTTEGRLAATLARHGEGPAVAWIRQGDGSRVAPGARLSRGPFGGERPIHAPPVHGPYLLVIGEEPGTIAT